MTLYISHSKDSVKKSTKFVSIIKILIAQAAYSFINVKFFTEHEQAEVFQSTDQIQLDNHHPGSSLKKKFL